MKQRNSKLQMSESYFVGALLAVIGGYLDAYNIHFKRRSFW